MRKSIYLLLCIMLCLLLTQTAAFAADEGANIVYASALGHYADFVLTGDTTLIMDTERYLQTIISSDYALTVQGNYTLHVQSAIGNAVVVKSLRSTVPIEVLAPEYGIFAIENITISNNLIVNSGETCLLSTNGHITVNGATELTSSSGNALHAENGCIAINGNTNRVKIETKHTKGDCIYAGAQVMLVGKTVQITSASTTSLICGDDIEFGGNVTISAGLYDDSSEYFNLNVATGGKVTIQDGSSVTITGKYGLYGQKGVFMENGTLWVESKGGKSAVFAEEGRVSLNGNVTLKSTSTDGRASEVCVFGYTGVSLTGGTVQITSTSTNAVISMGDITLGGNITIDAGLNDYDSDSYLLNVGSVGKVTILDGSSVTITGKYGLYGRKGILMEDGNLHVESKGGNSAVFAEEGRVSLNGNVTLKSISTDGPASEVCVFGYAGVSLTGGTIQVTSTGTNAVISIGDITLGGNVTIGTGLIDYDSDSYVLNVGSVGKVTILDGSSVTVTGKYGLNGRKGVFMENGTLRVESKCGNSAVFAEEGRVSLNGNVTLKSTSANGPASEVCVFGNTGVSLTGGTIQITSTSPNALISMGDLTLGGNITIDAGSTSPAGLYYFNTVAARNIEIQAESKLIITGRFGLYGFERIVINGDSLNVSCTEGNAIEAVQGITLGEKIKIVTPENGKIRGGVVVDSQNNSAKNVVIDRNQLTGIARILGEDTYPGEKLEVLTSGFPSGYRLQWQRSVDNVTWSDISEANQDFYQTKLEDVNIYFRVQVTADGYSGAIYSESRQIKAGYSISFAANGGNGSMPSATVNLGSPYSLPVECGFTAPSGVAYTMGFSGNWMVEGKHAPVGSNNTADTGVYPAGTVITLDGNVTVKPVWDFVTCDVQIDNAHVDEDGFFCLAEGMRLSDVTVSRASGEIGSFYVYRILWLENDRIADTNVSALANSSKYTLDATISSGHPGWKITADTKLRFMIGGKVVGESKYSSFISYSGLADYYVDFHTPCVHTADAWNKDDGFHWHICTLCGAEYDHTEHVWDNGTVKGDKTTFTCTVCAQTRIESNDHQSIAALTIDLGTIVDGVTVPNVTGFKTSRDNALATITPVRFQWGGSVIRPGSNFFEEGAALTISTEITAKSGYYFLDSQYFPTSVYFEINGSLVRADVVFQTQYVAAATCTFTVPEAPLVEIELPQTVNPGDDMMTKLTECALNYNHTAQEIMVFAYCDGDLCAVNMNMGGSWAYSDSDSFLATLDLDPSVLAEAREMLTAQADHLYTITVTLFSSIPVERTRNDMIHISAGNAISATVDRNSNYNATAVYRPTEKHVVRIDETVATPVPGELPVTETTTDRRVRWTPTSRFTCGTAYTVVIDRIFTDTLDPNAVAYVNGYRANVTVAGAHQARITYTFEPFEHVWGPWTAINNTQFRHTCVNDASHVENVTCSSVMVLPAALCQIESEAFAGISAEVIVIPANCQSIAFDAFDGCPNLRFIINHANTTIIPPVGVEVIGD